MSLDLGTNGIRAKFDELNASSAFKIGLGFAEYIKNLTSKKSPSIALARDMRITSPAIFSAFAAGLMEAGANVYNFGLIPSPVSEWGLKKYSLDGLAIVTASHNPPEWNAIKFVDNKAIAISSQRGKEITKYLTKNYDQKISYLDVGQMFDYTFVLEEYKKAVLDFIKSKNLKLKKLKVIVDVGNGTSTLVLPDLLKELGMEVLVLNEKLDGTFPSRPSEPSKENLTKLISLVKQKKADFGVGLDGDSDRVTFVDEKGNWIIGDKCLAICANWLLELEENKNSNKKFVISTYATSMVLEEVAKNFGLQTIYSDIGAPYLSEKIFELKDQCLIAGEEVGGIVFPEFSMAKDGILSSCLLCSIVSLKPLSVWLENLPKFFNAKTKIKVSESKKALLINSLINYLEKNRPSDCLEFIKVKNGIRLNFSNSWVIIRASGTEDYIRIFAEAKDPKKAKDLLKKFEAELKNFI
jgi:phosphomannomutase/phosphoglucomutase